MTFSAPSACLSSPTATTRRHPAAGTSRSQSSCIDCACTAPDVEMPTTEYACFGPRTESLASAVTLVRYTAAAADVVTCCPAAAITDCHPTSMNTCGFAVRAVGM